MSYMYDQNYICIDLKSFYASVECVERGLDPLKAKLVVADPDRGDGTICLAVSPALKALGVGGRCRVFGIPKGIDYIKAKPRMQLYIDYSARIYEIYLRYISKDDIHVYSVDEAFFDLTPYLTLYSAGADKIAHMLTSAVLKETGITAVCGMGTNLYLAKVAMDIIAKHSPGFFCFLDETLYRKKLWDHRPLSDFWRIGRRTRKRLEKNGMLTMRHIAMADEELLFRLFGIDAELLIDHAWGRECTTMADIKKYRPDSKSLSSGQVLFRDYSYDEARLILKEMTDGLCLEMSAAHLVTDSVTFYIMYTYTAGIPACGTTVRLPVKSSSHRIIIPAVVRAYNSVINRKIPIRRISVAFNSVEPDTCDRQLTLFDAVRNNISDKDTRTQQMMISLRSRYGKNAVFKGIDLEDCATALERNMQIGGHRK